MSASPAPGYPAPQPRPPLRVVPARAPQARPAPRPPMVGWYDPGQLARTAIDVLVSTIFGTRADARRLEALESQQEPFDCSGMAGPNGELWIDYVADVGDGWNSTYAVAQALAQPELKVTGADRALPRGQILILGGDEVYPVGSWKAYGDRLRAPYEAALPESAEPHPLLFAVPGNHDWYDGLVAFTRLFSAHGWFAGWRCQQQRSYFALKLTHGWWLLGTDVQLGSDIDGPQKRFFETVGQRMEDGDRVILCNAEPDWVYEASYSHMDPMYTQRNLEFIEQLLRGRIQVHVAGDLHHYRRHATPEGRQKITAGGGGAFLHPTHGAPVKELKDGYSLKASFPDERTSRRLCWGNLGFLFRNPMFGVVTGLTYLMTAWTTRVDLSRFSPAEFTSAAAAALNAALLTPAGPFWGLAILAGFLLFTDTHSKRYRMIAGTLHGFTHVLAAFGVGWAATALTVNSAGLAFGSTAQLLAAGGLVLAGGWVIGSVILGLYLLISLNVFGRHKNEAFSSLKIADWKSFLRFRIDAEGNLTLFPIGIRRVPREWCEAGNGSCSKLEARQGQGSRPELIERPVRVGVGEGA